MYKPTKDPETVIVRPSATALLAISSTDRYRDYFQRRQNPSNPFSFVIQKNEAILNGFFKRIALTEFRMNWTLPNFASAWGNDSIVFNYITGGNAHSFVIVVPDQFLGAEELASTLQALIIEGDGVTAGIPGFQVAVQGPLEDDQLSFIAPSGYTFWFTPSGYTPLTQISASTVAGAIVTFTVASTAGLKLGQPVLATGITGGTGYNSVLGGVITAIPSSTSVSVTYTSAPTGAPTSYAGASLDAFGTGTRQLFDMLALPIMTSPGVFQMYTGVPDLRATEYVDLVCTNLTGNMANRDATSATISRDMIARIYLDDDVPSQALVTTNYYNNTPVSNPISAGTIQEPNIVRYTVSSTGLTVGEQVTIAGITGGQNYNSSECIVAGIAGSTTVLVEYLGPLPNGAVISYTGATLSTTQGALTQTSKPVTTWDDRVNGVTPFCLYRQFPVPKQIRWDSSMPIANMRWEMYDSQGRSLSQLWEQYGGGLFNQPISAVVLAGQQVTATVRSTAGMKNGQLVLMSGFTGGGYNNQAVITSVPTATSVVVNYAPITPTGASPTLTYATIESLTDFQSSFAWNCSVLCSED